MTDAIKLALRDQKKRDKNGWSSMAFIPPELPKPRIECEIQVRALFHTLFGQTAYLIHIYDVLEAMEKAYELGKSKGKGD